MSDGLQQVINYMIPAVGTPRGYVWTGTLSSTPVTIDFRNVSGGGIDGQPFRPSGIFIDNTRGTGNVVVTINEISYQMICLTGELLNLQFPAPIDVTASFIGLGEATLVFVDFPVLPYRNLASAIPSVLWGSISGTLADQTDLQAELDNKITEPGGQTEGDVLTISSGVPKWEPPAGGGVAFAAITGDAFDNTNLGDYLTELFNDKLAEPGGTGIVVKTTAGGGVTVRTITGTANKVSVTNGDGVSGNPTLTLPDVITLVTPTVTGLLDCTGGQIKFPATQVPSADVNTLDDYEEGAWTPAVTFATPGNLSVAYTTQAGRYTKIGRMVHASFQIVTSSFTHTTASGNLQLTGFPFTNGTLVVEGALIWGGITKASYTQISAQISASATSAIFVGSGSGVAPSNVVVADVPTGGSVVLTGTIVYNV
ncbi:MAG TPA: hypothetical protein VJM50_19940 [Pyrinomonadaceae bacterium]|nr:hypothetical protein [Pyrinomonadaceae bacterium]